MKAWALVAPQRPLECIEIATPEPEGEQNRALQMLHDGDVAGRIILADG